MFPRDRDELLIKRKCVHLKLLRETFNDLRIECFKRDLSMQEVLEALSQRVAVCDPSVMEILDQLVIEKRETKIRKICKSDADSIFDLIHQASNKPT